MNANINGPISYIIEKLNHTDTAHKQFQNRSSTPWSMQSIFGNLAAKTACFVMSQAYRQVSPTH